MSQQNVTLRLTIVEGDQGTRVEEIGSDQAPIKVGRLSSSHLRFEDSSVSRIHAVFERAADGSLSLIDLGSASGTYVNGERITKQPVSHGDEIRFGNVVVNLAFVQAASNEFVEEATMVTAGLQAPQPQVSTPQPSGGGGGGVQIADSYMSQPQQEAQPVAAPQQADYNAYQEPVAQPQVQQPAYQEPQQPMYQEQVSAPQAAAPGMVTAADGSQVEPYTLQGFYDEHGNYLPGYYDEHSDYHLGYGYYDDAGEWQIAFGYYDPEGTWIETDFAIASVDELSGPSNMEYYTEAFFDGRGGDTLEVAMLWADQVLAVNTYSTPRSVMIGASEKLDFVIEDPALTSEEYPLIAYDGSSYQLVITPQMTGMVQNGDQRLTLQEAIAQGVARQGGVPGGYVIPLGSRTSARVDIGSVTFLAHFTEQPAVFWPMFTVGAAFVSLLGFVALSAVLQGSFVAIALTSPIDPNGLELDAFSADDRFVQAMIMPEQEEEEEEVPDTGDDAGEEAAAKHQGEEGQAGKEDSEQTNKELAIAGPSDNQEIQLKRAQDTQVAVNSGALAVMGDMVASPFGTASESVGSDAIHAMGNLEGDGVGNAQGFGGLGLAGAGRGGGGVSERGIGLADVGTRGRGGRGGSGSGGYGGSAGDLGKKKSRVPKLIPGKPKVVGSLDREIIRRVVRRHRNEIRHCYEKQLQKNPKLAGTVKVKFVIAGTGSVMSATISSSDLNNSAVEQCMTQKIRRWTFPEPTGGGIVNVNYPFKFSS